MDEFDVGESVKGCCSLLAWIWEFVTEVLFDPITCFWFPTTLKGWVTLLVVLTAIATLCYFL